VTLFPTYPGPDNRPEYVAVLDPPDTTLFPADAVTAGLDRLPGLEYRVVVHRDGVVIWGHYDDATRFDASVH
jgi:hypothetical protein